MVTISLSFLPLRMDLPNQTIHWVVIDRVGVHYAVLEGTSQKLLGDGDGSHSLFVSVCVRLDGLVLLSSRFHRRQVVTEIVQKRCGQ